MMLELDHEARLNDAHCARTNQRHRCTESADLRMPYSTMTTHARSFGVLDQESFPFRLQLTTCNHKVRRHLPLLCMFSCPSDRFPFRPHVTKMANRRVCMHDPMIPVKN